MAAAPHARSLVDLKDTIETVAAFSPTPARRAEFASTFALPVSDDLEAILADGSIEAILLLTPPDTHLDLVGRAASAGKHILLEKPLEISLARSEELVRVAANAGIKLGIVLQHRFRPVSEALRGMMTSRRLGELVSASARLYNWRPQSYYDQPGRGTRARDGGGVLLTQGIHTLDLMISVAGLPVEAMGYAATSPVHRMETEDIAMGAVRFANGALGTIAATTAAFPGFPDAIDVIGTKGTARLDGSSLVAHFDDGSEVTATDDSAGGGSGADPMAFSHAHHRALIADFADAIAHDREPRVAGREALKAHRLIEALLRSAATRTPQDV